MLAAADSGVGEYAVTQVQELASPSAPPVLDTATMRKDATAAGRTVLSLTLTASQAYQYLLRQMGPAGAATSIVLLRTGRPARCGTGVAATAT